MSVIAIPFFSNGKLKAHICWVNEKTYKKHMENGEINEYTVSATFTRKYLSDRGYSYEYFEALSKHPIVKTEHLVAEWRFADVLEIHSLKEIFNVVNLNFHEFIEAYCEHLKSL